MLNMVNITHTIQYNIKCVKTHLNATTLENTMLVSQWHKHNRSHCLSASDAHCSASSDDDFLVCVCHSVTVFMECLDCSFDEKFGIGTGIKALHNQTPMVKLQMSDDHDDCRSGMDVIVAAFN